jgi:hypothetical protein
MHAAAGLGAFTFFSNPPSTHASNKSTTSAVQNATHNEDQYRQRDFKRGIKVNIIVF